MLRHAVAADRDVLLRATTMATGLRRPRHILLVRHGESEANVNSTILTRVPDYQVHLTVRGVQQSRACAREMLERQLVAPDVPLYCWVSPFERSKHTFEEITMVLGTGGVRPRRAWFEPRLREQEFSGGFHQLDELDRAYTDREAFGRFHFRLTGGESGADVYDRVDAFLESLFRFFGHPDFEDGGVVLIVTHGLTLRLFLTRLLHWLPELFDEVPNPANASCTIVRCDPNRRPSFHLTAESAQELHLREATEAALGKLRQRVARRVALSAQAGAVPGSSATLDLDLHVLETFIATLEPSSASDASA